MRLLIARVGLALGLVLVYSLAALPTSAAVGGGPSLNVANPSAGAMLVPGKYVITGVAFDPLASTGTGVDRVSVFLDDRDSGGLHLGDATLGLPNTAGSNNPQFASAGWIVTTPALEGYGTGHTICVYARSSVTGLEQEVEIPIFIGEKPEAGPSAVLENPVLSPVENPVLPPTGDLPPPTTLNPDPGLVIINPGNPTDLIPAPPSDSFLPVPPPSDAGPPAGYKPIEPAAIPTPPAG